MNVRMATYDGTMGTNEIALAKVGLDAVIDEATGYQDVRPDGELAERYQKYAEDRNSIDFWLPEVAKTSVPIPTTKLVHTDIELVRLLDGEAPDGWAEFLDEIAHAADEIEAWPCFLRTGHTSGKHCWKRTCYVETVEDLPAHVCAIVEESHMPIPDLPTDVWAVRKMLDVEPLFHCAAFGNMPIIREFRLFVEDGEVSHTQPYWPADAVKDARPDSPEWRELLRKASRISWPELRVLEAMAYLVNARLPGYWSMDFLQDRHGDWFLTDMAEGDRSFRWEPEHPVTGEVHDLSSGQRLVGVHSAEDCSDDHHCALHNPSDHHMRDWPLVWRGDGPGDIWRGFERQCPHGVGHPDPDDAAFRISQGEECVGVHGCCGCCHEG